MATVTHAYSTCFGEAIHALLDAWRHFGSSIIAGSLSVTWVSDTGDGFPGWKVLCTVSVGGAMEYRVNIADGGISATPAYLSRCGGPSTQVQCQTGSAPYTAADRMDMSLSAIEDGVVALCGGVTTDTFQFDHTFTGRSRPGFSAGSLYFGTGLDVGMIQIAIYDVDNLFVPSYFAVPTQVPTIGGAIVYQGGSAAQSSDSLPLDIDVAINNGANMFSVFSKTFTEPGP